METAARLKGVLDQEDSLCGEMAEAHVQMLTLCKEHPTTAALVLEKSAYQDRIRDIVDEILSTNDLSPDDYVALTDEMDEMQFGIGTINNIFKRYDKDEIESFQNLGQFSR